MMVGVPGSGKSFFAGQFSATFSTPYIHTEEIGKYTADDAACLKMVAHMLTEIAKTNATFVFEGSSDTKLLRAEFAKFAKDHGYEPLFVWVQADRTTSRQRSIRKGMAQEEYLVGLERFEPPTEAERAVVVSGRHTYASQLRLVLNHIGNDNRTEQPASHARPASPVVPTRTNRTSL